MDLKGKKVTVVGLGNSGFNAAILLHDIGADVRVTDSSDTPATKDCRTKLEAYGIKVETGRHTEDFIKSSELIVVSPGVEAVSDPIVWAERYGIPIIGEMELGYRFCAGKIIAITGTNGKSTVTTLIGEILKAGGKDTVVCGNIGNSLCGEIGKIKKDTWVVLEVSSFQLERIEKFKPHIALILNITDDHMDRYSRFSDYFSEKLKVYVNQDKTDILILNYDAKELRSLADRPRSKVLFYSRKEQINGAYLKNGKVYCVSRGSKKEVCSAVDTKLKGLHNIENILACALVGTLAGVSEISIKNAVRDFKGLSHRFETVGMIDGVEYIDDSKGTTVDSTYRALESCDRPVVLIAGGKDKHSNYSTAKDVIKKKVKDLVLIGEATEAIKKDMCDAVNIREAGDMFEAVEQARRLAKSGDIVLLSPMCSSFDMFSSYKERGEVFRKAVMNIKHPCAKARL